MTIDYRTAEDARQAGQLDAWRDSNRAIKDAAHMIEKAIDAHFDGWTLQRQALDDVLENASPDVVEIALACAIKGHAYDGRFSSNNKAWAAGVRLPAAAAGCEHWYCPATHPAILDGFVSMFRRWQAEQ